MHTLVVVGQIVGIGLLIHALLLAVHALKVVEIVRILHSQAIFRVGEIGDYALAALLGLGHISVAHIHKIHVVVGVEAVHIVGVSAQQFVELIGRSLVVLKLVLKNHTHVVEALLNYIVGRLHLLGGLWNLL